MYSVDKHNNTLFVELSKDGTYWNINSAGIFNAKYASGNKVVYNRHTQVKQPVVTVEGSPNSELSDTQKDASTMPSILKNDLKKISRKRGRANSHDQ